MDKYGHVLDPKSNLYRRHQMVQSFLWMQLNKEKDNPGLNQQGLAQIVTNSFNRRAYTGRKIIHWGNALGLKIVQYQVQKLESTNMLYHRWKIWFDSFCEKME